MLYHAGAEFSHISPSRPGIKIGKCMCVLMTHHSHTGKREELQGSMEQMVSFSFSSTHTLGLHSTDFGLISSDWRCKRTSPTRCLVHAEMLSACKECLLDLLHSTFYVLHCCYMIGWLDNCVNVQVFLLKWTRVCDDSLLKEVAVQHHSVWRGLQGHLQHLHALLQPGVSCSQTCGLQRLEKKKLRWVEYYRFIKDRPIQNKLEMRNSRVLVLCLFID